MAVWYLSSVGYSSVPAWTVNTAKTVGSLVRATAPAINSERVFVCIIAGTTHSSTQPTWVLTKGARTTDNTVTWQECTGNPGTNGDNTNISASLQVRNTNPGLGRIIRNDIPSHLFICSVAGTTSVGGPTYNTTVGATTVDGGATWTCIAAIGAYATWAAPHARLVAALATAFAAAGDDVFVADNHDEIQASAISATIQGTAAGPCNVWCIDRTVALPVTDADLRSDPYSSSPACAKITTTGNNAITFSSTRCNFYGIIFTAGSGGTTAANLTFSLSGNLVRCSLRQMSSGGSIIQFPSGDVIDTSIETNATGSSVRNNGRTRWVGSTQPAVLTFTARPTILVSTANSGEMLLDGIDLSDLGSGYTYIGGSNVSNRTVMQNCKINGSVTAIATIPTERSGVIDVIACDWIGGAQQTLRQERYLYEGTLAASLSVTRDGAGPSDGTNTHMWLVSTNANARFQSPFRAFPLVVWNSTTGSPLTVTVYCNIGTGTANNGDIWMETEYYADAATPFATTVSNSKTNYLSTATTTHPSDSSVWAAFAGTPFKMEQIITPQKAGYVTVRIMLAKPSTTFAIDRRLFLS